MRHTIKLIPEDDAKILEKIKTSLIEKRFRVPVNETEFSATDFKSIAVQVLK
jgi:hypothetical protein